MNFYCKKCGYYNAEQKVCNVHRVYFAPEDTCSYWNPNVITCDNCGALTVKHMVARLKQDHQIHCFCINCGVSMLDQGYFEEEICDESMGVGMEDEN